MTIFLSKMAKFQNSDICFIIIKFCIFGLHSLFDPRIVQQFYFAFQVKGPCSKLNCIFIALLPDNFAVLFLYFYFIRIY